MPRSFSRLSLLLAVAAMILTACGTPVSDPDVEVTIPVLTTPAAPTPTAAPAAGTPTAPPKPEPTTSPIVRKLDQLRVTARPPARSAYRRSAFGTRWKDIDGNGCNQRDDVLVRDAVKGTVRVKRQGSCDHDVVAGTWRDPYAGREHHVADMKKHAQTVQIDHVVPLAEAWVSGASDWSDQRRERFANWRPGLLAVDGSTNASKGASDPAAWRPRKDYQCAYAVRWISTKHRWGLAVDPSEVHALEEMLAFC